MEKNNVTGLSSSIITPTIVRKKLNEIDVHIYTRCEVLYQIRDTTYEVAGATHIPSLASTDVSSMERSQRI